MTFTKRKLFSEPLTTIHEMKSLPIKKRKLRVHDETNCQALPGTQSLSSFGDSKKLHPCFTQAAIEQRKGFLETFKKSVKADILALLCMNAQCLPQSVKQNESLLETCKDVKRQANLNQTHELSVFDEMWQHRYGELALFWKQNGHSCVPQRYPANKALGKWVHKQRQEYKKKRNGLTCSLTPYRIKSLVKLQFQFDPTNRAEGLWQRRYKELIRFQKLHGHCLVPQKYAPNRPLGKWVHRQRHEFSKGLNNESSFLTKKRIDSLNKIGFQWFLSRNKVNEERIDCLTKCVPRANLCVREVLTQRQYPVCLGLYGDKTFSNMTKKRPPSELTVSPNLYTAASSA